MDGSAPDGLCEQRADLGRSDPNRRRGPLAVAGSEALIQVAGDIAIRRALLRAVATIVGSENALGTSTPVNTYQRRIREPDSGFFSIELPLDAGVELSVRLES